MTKLTKARIVSTLFPDGGHAPVGDVRPHQKSMPNGHPADGMTASVSFGGGAVGTIIDPRSFADGGPEWVCRYGDIESIRYTVASLLESYDYLLSSEISQAEAIRRLRMMRAGRSALRDAG